MILLGNFKEVVWKVGDLFRNHTLSGSGKQYVLALLFLRYLSVNAKKGKVRNFKLPEESTFAYLLDQRKARNIAELLDNALKVFTEANPKQFATNVFSACSFTDPIFGLPEQRNALLAQALLEFNAGSMEVGLLQAHYPGDSFEQFLAKYADIEKQDLFFTPLSIIDLIATLASRNKGNTIYDPVCGTGTMLVKTCERRYSDTPISLYGQDLDPISLALATMNIIMHGNDACDLRAGNTITSPQFTKDARTLQTFDCIVACPPLAVKDWTQDPEHPKYRPEEDPFNRFSRGIPPVKRSDWAFLSHIIESLSDQGEAFVIVPEGALYRTIIEDKIRRNVILENLVHAVIALPPNMLYGSGIASAIIVLRKKRKKSDILIINTERGVTREKYRNVMPNDTINEIFVVYSAFSDEKQIPEQKYIIAKSLDTLTVEEHDYSLKMSEYINDEKPQERRSLESISKDIAETELALTKQSKLIDELLKTLQKKA
jgi:type I restriction enzyme M protein